MKNTVFFILLVVFQILFYGCGNEDQSNNEKPESKDLILGSWQGAFLEEGNTITVSTTFTEDKKWSQNMDVKVEGWFPGNATASGEWDIENEFLILKVKEGSSSIGKKFQGSASTSSKIMSISQERLILDENGKTRTYEKITSQ